MVRTATISRVRVPVAYDCVKVIIVRDGSAILFSEFGEQPVGPGDVILLGANTLCGSEPEGHITVTTIYADTDYVIDQVFWQHVGSLCHRLDAQDFAATMYTEPAQVLRLGEDRTQRMFRRSVGLTPAGYRALSHGEGSAINRRKRASAPAIAAGSARATTEDTLAPVVR